MNGTYANSTLDTAALAEASNSAKFIQRVSTGLRVSATLLLDTANKVVFLGFSYLAALAATTLLFHVNRILRNSIG